MSCRFSREMLALHVEGDLPDAAAATTVRHLASCEECRRLLEELQDSQALLKSSRRETIHLPDCAAVRRQVMSEINNALGWRLRLERVVALGLRPSYGLAAVVLCGVVSVTMLAQMRPVSHQVVYPAVEVPRLEGYEDWILVRGATSGDAAGPVSRSDGRVYINPSSYQEYAETGVLPDGTTLVWQAAPEGTPERAGPHATSATLLVSVKDPARFEGGWGFFDFSGNGGNGEGPPEKARALPASSGCASCHRQGPISLQVGWSRAILTS